MSKKLTAILLLSLLFIVVFSTVVYAAGSADELTKKTKDFGKWLKDDFFSTLGLIGFLIGAGLVIFGNSGGLKQIGMVLAVLALVAAYDVIWDMLIGFFGK